MTPIDAGAVPHDETTAHDFMMIRAALVRRLGGANAALVWTRVHFRAAKANPESYEHGGVRWWRANRDVVADETGLTPSQARRTLEELVKAGSLIAEQHHLEGKYDQTKSYRCNVVEAPTDHWSDLTNERADLTNVDRSDLTDVDWSDPTNLLSKTPVEDQDQSSPSSAPAPGPAQLDDRGISPQGSPQGGKYVNEPAIRAHVLHILGREIDSGTSLGIIGLIMQRRGAAPLVDPTAYIREAISRDPFGWQSYIDTRKIPA